MTGPSRRHLKNRMECQQALTACASIDQPAVVHVAGGELVGVPRQSRPLQPQDLILINASQRANGKIFAAQSERMLASALMTSLPASISSRLWVPKADLFCQQLERIG